MNTFAAVYFIQYTKRLSAPAPLEIDASVKNAVMAPAWLPSGAEDSQSVPPTATSSNPPSQPTVKQGSPKKTQPTAQQDLDKDSPPVKARSGQSGE